ncbi:MAG: hypothetical protein K9J81_09135 [Desulfohalobiaceae bacterium]|nr:hypothetical protein [Desulfohalobiaceae bacterium]
MRRHSVSNSYSPKRLDWIRLRIVLLGCLLGAALLGLWGRAYYIQIVMGPDLSHQASDQHWIRKSTYGHRGHIKDAKGNLLAKSVRINSVFVRPKAIEKKEQTVQTLSSILDGDRRHIRQAVFDDRSFVWLERKISDSKAGEIRSARLPGVHLSEEMARFYPQGTLAGQLLGFVGVDNTGLEGLECSYNAYLAGQRKEFMVQRDASGNLLFAPGQLFGDLAGKDLVLTLDKQVQIVAEEALARAVQKNRAERGLCLVVKVTGGDILAWAQYPFFNPNTYQDSKPEIWKNKIALDVFEPGSTMKPVLVATALETQTCRRQDIFFCENGEWPFAGQIFNDTHEYGWLPVNKIIRYSSNIGAAKIGLQLGSEVYFEYLRALGLGRRTQLPLPGEAEGILRPAGDWTQVDLVAASFGQGVGVTLLQLAQSYLCLANKGLLQPLKLIHEPASPAPAQRVRVFSRSTAQAVLEMMTEVVEEDGTGTRARIPGMFVGGKTGTSQKASKNGGYTDRYTASFIGLFPGLDPEYLIIAVIDEPKENHYGGVVAAPAVRRVAAKLVAGTDDFQHYWAGRTQQKTQDRKGEQPKALSRVIPKAVQDGRSDLKNGKMPDLRGVSLRRAVEILAEHSIIPKISGQGVRIGDQQPHPGVACTEHPCTNVVLNLVEE